MLDSELNDRESNDNPAGRGAPELTRGVPAAVFQPPPVVFQPPAVRPEPAWQESTRPESTRPESGRPEQAQAPARSQAPVGTRSSSGGQAGDQGAPGDDDDGAGNGRRRRRRPTRSQPGSSSRTGDGGEGTPESDPQAASPAGAQAAQPARTRTRSRRASTAKDAAETAPADQPASAEAADGSAGPEADDDDDAGANGVARRRRRKRRRGSAEGADTAAPDDPPDTVVHVREPSGPTGQAGPAGQASPASTDDVRSVRGSTRLEAKKQRRREGRETGRRRPPIVTESEFLARRESVERAMVVRQRKDRTQIAVLEDNVLVEHYVNRASNQSYVGNVYLGKVQNVLPSMEAAFVDIGKGRNAVLYAGEVNFDVSGMEGQPKRIESALKAGQALIVQVTKDPVGHKGARLTSQVSLPGRYLVYVPGASMTGISRKLPDIERNRLKGILKKVMPENAGVIVRTAAEGAAEEELARDVARLAAQWEAIEKKAKTASAPALLYGEPDLTIRVIRDVFNEDFSSLVVSGDEAWDVVDEYVKYVAPHLAGRLTRWQENRDVFGAYRVDEQLAKALERKVWLPSGGSLVIDKTEAMTVVDVNTGKFTGQGGNLEETVTRNNLEAAEELVRQLRLRDVGGIVVIDFIDMVLESNRELVLRRLLECLSRDRTKHQVAEVTSLGLVQMTRKRVGAGLLEAFSVPCECCNGRGVIITFEPDADGHATHHVHPRSLQDGPRQSGGRPPAPSQRPQQAADGPAADGQAADGQEPDELQPEAAAASNGQAEPARPGSGSSSNGRRRRRRSGSSSATPANATTTDAVPADAVPANAGLAGAMPADAVPADAVPTDAGPASAGPASAAPASAAPAGAAPARAGRVSTRPAGPPTPPEAPAIALPEPSQAQDGAA
jgi:ribonuclease E